MSQQIGIIGGGFTGTMAAIRLANAAPTRLAIEVIERRPEVGFGLAYGSAAPEHRINVPSDKMSGFTEKPFDFTTWLERNGRMAADPAGFAPNGDFYSTREDFGRYVAQLFSSAVASNPSGSSLRHRRQDAVSIAPDGASWRVGLDDGTSAVYDQLIFAATHAIPEFRAPIDAAAEGHPGLIADPWDFEAIRAVPADADLAIIGTGLTMCDVVVTLRANGHRGRIRAISRRGLTPRAHAAFSTSFDIFGQTEPPATAIGLLRLVRQRIADAEEASESWHVVVDALRFKLATYWRTLPLGERRKIARFLRSWWDVHRFRIAPQVDRLIRQGRKERWLIVDAGRIHGIGRAGDRLVLDWRAKGGAAARMECGAIINCTGPDADISRSPNQLLRAAVEAGHIRPDDLRIGIDVDAAGHAIGRNGAVTPGLWAAGPLARAIVGEATGVPEASNHARLVAEALAETLPVPSRSS